MNATAAGIQVWEPLATSYEGWFESELGAYIAARELEALDAVLPPAAGSAIEIGAGTGFISRALAARGWRVTAAEPSLAMRREGMSRSPGPGVTWHDARAEALPFPDGAYDLALFFTSLEFIEDPARALFEAVRVVRPGGCLAVGILDARSPWTALYRHLADHGEAPWHAARFYAPADLDPLVGWPAGQTAGAVFLAPDAAPPYGEADAAGRRAGNHGSIAIMRWGKPG